MAEANEVEKLIQQLFHGDAEQWWNAGDTLRKLNDRSVVPLLAKGLFNPDSHVKMRAAMSLVQLGDRRGADYMVKVLNEMVSDGRLRSPVPDWIPNLVNHGLVDLSIVFPPLIRLLNDPDESRRSGVAWALRCLVTQPAQIKVLPQFLPKATVGEYYKLDIEIANHGAGPAFCLKLRASGPATGEAAEMEPVSELKPNEKASLTVSIRPDAPGSHVPLHWELTYDDINGPDQKLQGILYLAVEKPTAQPSVAIGNLIQGPVDGLVIGKVNPTPATKLVKPFAICPYCGRELNLPKTPRFCPYCKENLASER